MKVQSIIIFYLLFVVCREANGARSVRQQKQLEENSGAYLTSYGTKEATEEVQAPYITQYGSKEGRTEEVVEAPYITGYISAQDTKGTKEVEAYISAQGAKSTETVEIPYITQYGDKKASHITQEGTKEGTLEAKEVEAPYIAGYISARGTKATKQAVEAPYITGYISAQGAETVEIPYLTEYGDKEASHITQEGTKERTLESKEVEAPYITGYISAQDTKATKQAVEEPYITGYISAPGTKGTKEVEAPYITGYISTQGAKKCEHQKHVHPPSQDEAKQSPMGHHQHHDHMHAHSSSPMDHTEALKQGFFTLEDFYKGNTLPLNFPKQEHSRFLPKVTADSIPFSSSQLPHLLQLFSTPRDSREAKHMAWTLDQCELQPIKGKTKFCATSLESMTEFVQKIIGSGVRFDILSTTHPETFTAITQKYTILEEPEQIIASKMVFCLPVPYPYAVFFCHHFENDTKFFKVSLRGENGDKVKAVAVCHMDTSDWDPNHALFRLLGITAGASSPVCHFFPANHLVWLPSSPTTANS